MAGTVPTGFHFTRTRRPKKVTHVSFRSCDLDGGMTAATEKTLYLHPSGRAMRWRPGGGPVAADQTFSRL